MRLTAKSEYGLLAAIDLAVCYGQGPVSAREIAERRSIPPRFLEQILVALRQAGIVTAVRGAHGGFVLTDDPAEINVLRVVEALEGPLSENVCDTDRGMTCGQMGACAAQSVWIAATDALHDVFAGRTLGQLAGSQSLLDSGSKKDV